MNKLFKLVQNELDSCLQGRCRDSSYDLVLSWMYDRYRPEIETVYGQLQCILSTELDPIPDKWARKYDVDLWIQVKEKYIGLQIKSVSSGQSINQYQWIEMHEINHEKFKRKFGGEVFYIFSVKSGKKKKIYNVEMIEEILKEIERLAAEG